MAAGAYESMIAASPFPIVNGLEPEAKQGFHAHPHESFSAAAALKARLRQTVRGEVRFDDGSRALYATDASNYRQIPIGIVVPFTVNDVVATMAACCEFGAPVLSREGGTSPAGQCCNVTVVIDFSKHLNAILARSECMLQSYTCVIRLFPNIENFGSARFEKLRAAGAFLVSASHDGKSVVRLKIFSEKGRTPDSSLSGREEKCRLFGRAMIDGCPTLWTGMKSLQRQRQMKPT